MIILYNYAFLMHIPLVHVHKQMPGIDLTTDIRKYRTISYSTWFKTAFLNFILNDHATGVCEERASVY